MDYTVVSKAESCDQAKREDHGRHNHQNYHQCANLHGEIVDGKVRYCGYWVNQSDAERVLKRDGVEGAANSCCAFLGDNG